MAGPHSSGRVVGPPHKRRYCVPRGDSDIGRALAKVETGAASAAVRRLLARITGVRPVARDSTIRRFRPGRDYTVAVSGDPVPVVDATFCFLGGSDDEAWASGEVGGFETYIEAEDEGDADAAVYDGDAGEGGDEGGDLLSVEAQHNCLSIVLRDPGTLRFVKYVSAFAPSARCDVEVVCRIHDEDLPDPDASGDESDE